MNKKLLTAFNALASDEQEIMLALAVIYAPIGQSSLASLLAKSSGFELKTIRLINKPLRDKLLQAALMVTSQDGWRCNEAIAEPLMRLAINRPWFNKLAQLLIAEPSYFYATKVSIYHAIKILRIFLYQRNESGFAANIERFYSDYRQKFADTINKIFFNNYDAAWFASLPDQIKALVLSYFLHDGRMNMSDVSIQYQLLEQFFGAVKHANPTIVHAVIDERLLRGNFKDAEQWLTDDPSENGLSLLATLRFLQNRNDEAIALFNAALKALKKATGKRNISIDGLHGYFFNLALLRSRNPNTLLLLKQQAQIVIKQGWNNEFYRMQNKIYIDWLKVEHEIQKFAQTEEN